MSQTICPHCSGTKVQHLPQQSTSESSAYKCLEKDCGRPFSRPTLLGQYPVVKILGAAVATGITGALVGGLLHGHDHGYHHGADDGNAFGSWI